MSRIDELMALADAYAYAGNIDPDASRAALERALRDALEPTTIEDGREEFQAWWKKLTLPQEDRYPAWLGWCAALIYAAAPKEPTK